MKPTILITGAAGFIGSQLAAYLIDTSQYNIIGTDIFDPLLDNQTELHHLKKMRLQIVAGHANYTYIRHDLRNEFYNNPAFDTINPTFIFHFGGASGVHEGEIKGDYFWDVNSQGTARLLNWANTKSNVKHVFIASSSSVYGNSRKIPYKETDPIGLYRGLYAKSKLHAELSAAHNKVTFSPKYQHTILRLFSVYGPYGRPDMAPWMITERHVNYLSPTLTNGGDTLRDYTYIDDVVNILSEMILGYENINFPEILNIGTGRCIQISQLNEIITRITKSNIMPVLNPKSNTFDMPVTMADVDLLNQTLWPDMPLAFTPIEEGMMNFIAWYRTMQVINKCKGVLV